MACIPASAIVRVIAQVLGVSGGSGTTTSTPIPPITEDRFLTQPTVTPTSGNTGQSFTANPGTATVPIDRVEWKLNGAVFSTALTIVSSVSGTFTFQSFAGTAESNVITVPVSAAIPAIVTPFTVGMNSAGAGASSTEFFMRDLALHGRWIVQGGPSTNQDFDPSLLDPVTYFPMSLPTGATGAKLAVTDGAWIGAKGTYTWTIDSRFTVTSTAVKNLDNVNDPDIVFTGTGGSGQVAIGGIPRRSGWSLTVTGPFDALTAGQRGLKILPLNDANPQRLYSDAIRASLVAGGVRHWRPMEDLRVNYADVIPYLTDKGPKTGLPSASIDAIVQLCNDLNMGLTWDFHAVSPDAFINRVSLYVAANLKRGLLFYPAYGNEGDWNEAFPQVNYERHQAWLKGYAATGGARPPCVGWTTTSFVPSSGQFGQPFDPDYTTTGGAPYSGRTNVALNAGDFIFGGIYGYGNGVWRVANNMPSGSIFPPAGNGNFVLIAPVDTLNEGKHRFYADRTLAIYQATSAAWIAAGHDVSKCRPIINVQSGPTLGVEKQILDANNFALWSTPFSVQQAPYFYSILGDDVGAGPVAQFLDATFVTDRADIETKQHWVRDRRAAIRSAAPAGITLPDWCHEIYEWNHHNIFGGSNRFAFFNAYRRDARLGMLLKYGLTLHARDNPATLLQIFNIVTGEPLDANSGWGIYFYADEALSSSPTNPEGSGLKEWYEAAASGVPSVDIFCATAPAAGNQTISLLFGPQIGAAISGTVRITGGTSPVDLPFTKAANAPTASVTYSAEAGKTYSVNVLPQSGVFTVGARSLNVAVVTATPVPTALTTVPQPAARVAHWDASTITGVSDGDAITTWTDKIGGIPATGSGSGRPLFKSGVANSLPAVRCNGSNRLVIGRPAALTGPMANPGTWSAVCIFKNASGGGGGYPVMLGDSFGSVFLGASSNEMQNNVTRKSYSTPGQVNTLVYSGDSGYDQGRLFSNGTMFVAANGTAISGSGNLALCSDGSGDYAYNGDLLEVIIYNTGLSAPEALQAHQYACAKYGQALPHAGMARFPVFDGDSQTAGIGATPDTAYPIQVAATKSWPLGAFANVGKPSASVAPGSGSGNNMSDRAARDVDGFKAVTGLPITLIWFEYYNRGGSGLALYNESAAYNAARRAADSTLRIVSGTSLSSYNRDTTDRADYNSQMVANKAGADVVVALHTNANVGVNGAAGTTTAGNAKFADGVHPTASGYGDVAGMIGPAI